MAEINQTETRATSSDSIDAEFASEGKTIDVQNIRKTFDDGNIVAVKDFSIEINPDEFVVLLGPSGCGKTTTLRSIAGLESPDSGRILVGNEDIVDRAPKDRDLAFVFQEIVLYPHLTVRQNMRFGLDMKTDMSEEEKDSRVDDAAEMLGIEALLDRKPSALSGGQRQRVSLGRAMVMEPDAFLLDEPFSALDANLRDQMRVELKKLQRKLKRPMIFVTHNQEEAMTLGDTIVVMEDGEIRQKGSPHEIFDDPADLFVAEFIGSPQTNSFLCSVDVGADGAVLTSDWFSIQIDEVDELVEYDGEEVVFGVRPEYVELDPATSLFEAEVSVIEPHGSDDAIYLELDGHEVRAITDKGAVSEGSTVGVNFDAGDGWIFDRDGDRIR